MLKQTSMFARILVAAAVIGGCASVAPDEVMIYPSFPNEPKVVFVRSLQGALDFRKPSFLDPIFGAPSGSDFKKPYGVAAWSDKVYVADGLAHAVVVFDLKQEKVTYLGRSGQGKLSGPVAAAVAADGTVYVTDGRQKLVSVYDGEGKHKFSFGKDEFKNIGGIAINDEIGRLYIADSYAHMVRVYGINGEALFQFGDLGERDGYFRYPTQVAVDRRTGNVLVTDTQNFRVQVFDKDGKFLSKFGGLGDIPGTFSRPKGIGIDTEGHVYVADAAFGNFQLFDQNGQILLGVGKPGTGPGRFLLPAGLAVDDKDRIFVVDQLNKRVEVFQYLSESWKASHPDEYRKYREFKESAEPGRTEEEK